MELAKHLPGGPLKGSTDDANATAPKVTSSEPTCPSSVSGTVIHPVPRLGPGSLFSLTVGFQFSRSAVSNSVTPWTSACQASRSITNSQSLLKLMSIELVMSSNHLILCHPFSSCLQSFPASVSFPMSQFFESGGQSIGASASALVLPMNIQD